MRQMLRYLARSHCAAAVLWILLTGGNIFPVTAAPALPAIEPPSTLRFPSVFGAGETPGANFAAFRRWTSALERAVRETLAYEESCAMRFQGRCVVAEWRDMIRTLQDRPRREKIDRVNAWLNRFPYVLDPNNWGVADYWASPLQFLSRAGDCEDYAVAKYVTLRQLGFAKEELRVVVLDDTNLGIAHAILVVVDGPRLLVLDNQIKQVVEASRVLHYKPIYSINETNWWLHRGVR
jgi:predicted transglutaminase-like cysteine proteinase